jgi:hypothetical protein
MVYSKILRNRQKKRRSYILLPTLPIINLPCILTRNIHKKKKKAIPVTGRGGL